MKGLKRGEVRGGAVLEILCPKGQSLSSSPEREYTGGSEDKLQGLEKSEKRK